MQNRLENELNLAAVDSFWIGVSIAVCYFFIAKKRIKRAFYSGHRTGWTKRGEFRQIEVLPNEPTTSESALKMYAPIGTFQARKTQYINERTEEDN